MDGDTTAAATRRLQAAKRDLIERLPELRREAGQLEAQRRAELAKGKKRASPSEETIRRFRRVIARLEADSA